MAQLRREIIYYLKDKYNVISKTDGRECSNLIKQISWIISNHETFYGEFPDIQNFKVALTKSKDEIDEVDLHLNSIKNKTIKKFHVKFGMILLKNISMHIRFFRIRIVFILITAISNVIWATRFDALKSFLNWFDKKSGDFNDYGVKYSLQKN